jgi:hypothetical protein
MRFPKPASVLRIDVEEHVAVINDVVGTMKGFIKIQHARSLHVCIPETRTGNGKSLSVQVDPVKSFNGKMISKERGKVAVATGAVEKRDWLAAEVLGNETGQHMPVQGSVSPNS